MLDSQRCFTVHFYLLHALVRRYYCSHSCPGADWRGETRLPICAFNHNFSKMASYKTSCSTIWAAVLAKEVWNSNGKLQQIIWIDSSRKSRLIWFSRGSFYFTFTITHLAQISKRESAKKRELKRERNVFSLCNFFAIAFFLFLFLFRSSTFSLFFFYLPLYFTFTNIPIYHRLQREKERLEKVSFFSLYSSMFYTFALLFLILSL